MTPRRATIADVAREAGVSPSTASVVFSGKTPVSESASRRVRTAAAALGYTGPDPRAMSLRTGRSGIVGVVLGGPLRAAFLDPVKTLLMDGLTEGVEPLGAGLLLLREPIQVDAQSPLTTAPLDAVVLMGPNHDLRERVAQVRARGIPVVVIDGDLGDGVARISLDDREAQARLARHLRALGHEEVAIVTLPVTADRVRGRIAADAEIAIEVTRERLAGAREVYPDAVAHASAGSFIDEGLAAGRAILGDPARRPTAVIAQSDLLAAGVVRAAEELGLGVPADLSVTGFDGVVVDGLAPYELTTLVQPAVERGRAAGRAVARMLDGERAESIRFTSMFRQGNTTGPAPRRGGPSTEARHSSR